MVCDVDKALGREREMLNTYRILVCKLQSNKSDGGPNHRWMDNIKIVIDVMWRECVGSIHLARDRV
jgi:hypothetical protein